MREKIESLRALRAAAAAQPAPTLAENRASFDARGDGPGRRVPARPDIGWERGTRP
jgi:hypothetical protein